MDQSAGQMALQRVGKQAIGVAAADGVDEVLFGAHASPIELANQFTVVVIGSAVADVSPFAIDDDADADAAIRVHRLAGLPLPVALAVLGTFG